jgi:hypothetical protein
MYLMGIEYVRAVLFSDAERVSPWQAQSRPDATVSASTPPLVGMTLMEVLTLSDCTGTQKAQKTSLDGHRHRPHGGELPPSPNSTHGAECKN